MFYLAGERFLLAFTGAPRGAGSWSQECIGSQPCLRCPSVGSKVNSAPPHTQHTSFADGALFPDLGQTSALLQRPPHKAKLRICFTAPCMIAS